MVVAPREHAGRGLKRTAGTRLSPPPGVAPREHAGRGLKQLVNRLMVELAESRPVRMRGARIETTDAGVRG